MFRPQKEITGQRLYPSSEDPGHSDLNNQAISPSRAVILVTSITGWLILVLSVLVIYGWHTNNARLVQIHAAFAPMQYNTALAFLFSGVTLLGIVRRWSIPILVGSSLSFVIGLFTGLQYLFGWNLGIDELLMKHSITVATSNPGRMAPSTSVCFMLTGAALWAMHPDWWRPRNSILTGILGSLLMALSLVAIIGYISDIKPAYAWGKYTHMAIHTAAGFLLIAVTILVNAWHGGREQGQIAPRWFPAIAGLLVFAISITMWQTLESRDRQVINDELETRSSLLRNDMRSYLSGHIQILSLLADQWKTAGRPASAIWHETVSGLIAHYPSFQAIVWADTKYHVRWIVPLKGNEAAQNQNLAADPARLSAMMKARAGKIRTITDTVTLPERGNGFMVFAPVFVKSEFDGFIVGVFQINKMFNEILSRTLETGLTVRVSDDGGQIYGPSLSEPATGRPFHDSSFNHHGISWHLRVMPDPGWLKMHNTWLPEVILAGGFSAALLLALSLHFALIARERESALREAQKAYRAMVDHGQGLMCVHGMDGVVLSANPASAYSLGLPVEKIIGRNLREFLAYDFRNRFDAYLAEIKRSGNAEGIMRVVNSLGEERVWAYRNAVREQSGQDPVIVGHAHDITERQHAVDELREVAKALHEAAEGITRVNRHGLIISVNKSQAAMLGYIPEEMTGMSWLETVHPDDLDKLKHAQEKMEMEGKTEIELRAWRKDHTVLHQHIVMVNIGERGDRGNGCYCFSKNITDRKAFEAELRSMSFLDDLTGLYNRRGFLELSGQQYRLARRNKKKMLLLFIDLDGMKQINDRFGHVEGDKALVQTTEILRKTFRDSDIIARLGGDEFAILAIDTDESGAGIVLERLQNNISSYNLLPGKPYTLSMSVGTVSIDPLSAISLEELIIQADQVMYQNKKKKKLAK